MDNPEKLVTLDTKDTRRRQTNKQKTQDEDKQTNKKHNTIGAAHHYA